MNCWVLGGIGGKKEGNIKLSLGPSMNCWVLWGIEGKKGGNIKLSLFAKNLKFRVGYKQIKRWLNCWIKHLRGNETHLERGNFTWSLKDK